jgi:hypothetical protein
VGTVADKLEFADALPADIAIAIARHQRPAGIQRGAAEPVDSAVEG